MVYYIMLNENDMQHERLDGRMQQTQRVNEIRLSPNRRGLKKINLIALVRRLSKTNKAKLQRSSKTRLWLLKASAMVLERPIDSGTTR